MSLKMSRKTIFLFLDKECQKKVNVLIVATLKTKFELHLCDSFRYGALFFCLNNLAY